MKISEVIRELSDILQEKGDIPVFIADKYTHYNVKWIDHYEERTDIAEHACVRIRDE